MVEPRPRLIEPSSSTKREGGSDGAIRERVYRAIATHLRDVTGGEVSRAGTALGREILDAVTEIVIRTAIMEGYFRLPGGFGSFKVLQLRPSQKRLPTGEVVELKSTRSRLRYEEGAAVRELLGMPYKTSYKRKYSRQSKLSNRAADIAFPLPGAPEHREAQSA
jgi:hypothetical protein